MSTEISKDRLLILSRDGKWSAGIRLLRRAIKQAGRHDKQFLLINLATFLYHNSFTQKKYKINKDKDLKEAVGLCRKIIKDGGNSKSLNVINARFFLAQILASSGNIQAVKIARRTYSILRNSVSANRLANVYEILGNNKMAEKYYLEHEKLADKKNDDMLYVYLSIWIYYFNSNNSERVKYYKQVIEKMNKHPSYKQVKKILTDYVMTRNQSVLAGECSQSDS